MPGPSRGPDWKQLRTAAAAHQEEPGQGPPRAFSNLLKECGLHPKGHKKPLQGFKKGTDMTRLTGWKDHYGCSVKRARVKDKPESRETREDSSGMQVSKEKD